MTIRVAAIEVSHWHALYDAAYLRHLARMPDIQLVGLQDPDLALAKQRAAALGQPPVFTDYAQMLEEARPDFVLALGRHSVMTEIAHYLLDHGYPFIMEKPLGINASQVRSIVDKATATQGFAAVPLSQRYQPFAQAAQQMLGQHQFGPLSHIYIRINRPTSARYPAWGSPWMLDPAVAGGGCVRNLGTHGFDLFVWLTGEEARVTAAQLSWRALGQPVEDYASILLRSQSGVLGTIEVGNTMPRNGSDSEWKIVGRDALLVFKDGALRRITAAGEDVLPHHLSEAPAYLFIRDALDCWRRGAAPPISVADCYRAAQLIDQAYDLAGWTSYGAR